MTRWTNQRKTKLLGEAAALLTARRIEKQRQQQLNIVTVEPTDIGTVEPTDIGWYSFQLSMDST